MGEEALLLTLAGLKKDGVTVVIVAHRPSILAGVDKILALRPDGTVDAVGPRTEVIQQFTKRANPTPQPAPAQPAGKVVTLQTPDHGVKT
jgi:ABC-type protease/lipase transport system fused ATPase/permease subunit